MLMEKWMFSGLEARRRRLPRFDVGIPSLYGLPRRQSQAGTLPVGVEEEEVQAAASGRCVHGHDGASDPDPVGRHVQHLGVLGAERGPDVVVGGDRLLMRGAGRSLGREGEEGLQASSGLQPLVGCGRAEPDRVDGAGVPVSS